jgi:hypothetical protein
MYALTSTDLDKVLHADRSRFCFHLSTSRYTAPWHEQLF